MQNTHEKMYLNVVEAPISSQHFHEHSDSFEILHLGEKESQSSVNKRNGHHYTHQQISRRPDQAMEKNLPY